MQLVGHGSFSKRTLQTLAQHFLLHRGTVLLFQHFVRDFARTEAVYLGGTANTLQARFHFAAQLLLGDGRVQTALQSTQGLYI